MAKSVRQLAKKCPKLDVLANLPTQTNQSILDGRKIQGVYAMIDSPLHQETEKILQLPNESRKKAALSLEERFA